MVFAMLKNFDYFTSYNEARLFFSNIPNYSTLTAVYTFSCEPGPKYSYDANDL